MSDTYNAETAVIGSILIDDRCLPEVLGVLSADDFTLSINREIFATAAEMYHAGSPVDPILLQGTIGGGADYLRQLIELTPTAANVMAYAEEVRKASMRRQLAALGEQLLKLSASDDPGQAIADATAVLENIEATDRANELIASTQAVKRYYDYRAKIEAGKSGVVGTGYRSIDQLLGGGMLPGGLYVLAARPGIGKTTFALNIVSTVVKTGPVVFFSLEMSEEQITAKRIASQSSISSKELLTAAALPADTYKAIARAAKELAAEPFYLNQRPTASVAEIHSAARKVKGLKLLAIDYFGLIQPSRKNVSRYEAMTEISGSLKHLARSLNVPILLLAQLNRANSQRSDPRPTLSDLRDTGALEQDADAVMFLSRDADDLARSEDETPEVTELQVILAKNRHGPTGTRTMSYSLTTGRIRAAGPANKSTGEAARKFSQHGKAVKQANRSRQTSFYEMPSNDEDIPHQWKEDSHDPGTSSTAES